MSQSPSPPKQMLTEAEYMECVRNCHRANKAQIRFRQNKGPYVETQTGIVQSPTNHLVCRYIPNRWQRDSDSIISSDSIEHRLIMSANPTLRLAVDKLVQQKPATSKEVIPVASKEVIPVANVLSSSSLSPVATATERPSASFNLMPVTVFKKVKEEITDPEGEPCAKAASKTTPKKCAKSSKKKVNKAKTSTRAAAKTDDTSAYFSTSESVKLRPRLRPRKNQ
uniref:DPF1-3 N-terminal domain-containing protein n=1 Tax=Panagrellus redivivus TaxID=6233 RepID=A0A7E4ZWS6_PANRE